MENIARAEGIDGVDRKCRHVTKFAVFNPGNAVSAIGNRKEGVAVSSNVKERGVKLVEPGRCTQTFRGKNHMRAGTQQYVGFTGRLVAIE